VVENSSGGDGCATDEDATLVGQRARSITSGDDCDDVTMPVPPCGPEHERDADDGDQHGAWVAPRTSTRRARRGRTGGNASSAAPEHPPSPPSSRPLSPVSSTSSGGAASTVAVNARSMSFTSSSGSSTSGNSSDKDDEDRCHTEQQPPQPITGGKSSRGAIGPKSRSKLSAPMASTGERQGAGQVLGGREARGQGEGQSRDQGQGPGQTMQEAVPPSVVPMNPALIETVRSQIEYYFSAQNLCRDMYLRSQMDEQGSVSFETLLGFNRLKSMGAFPQLVFEALKSSDQVEIIVPWSIRIGSMPGSDAWTLSCRVRAIDQPLRWVIASPTLSTK